MASSVDQLQLVCSALRWSAPRYDDETVRTEEGVEGGCSVTAVVSCPTTGVKALGVGTSAASVDDAREAAAADALGKLGKLTTAK